MAINKIDVISTLHGEGAIEKIKHHMPNLVILDVNLPGVEGFDILRAMKQDNTIQHIPTIMLTKQDSNNSVIEGISEGAIDYITKPFEISKFIDRVINTLKIEKASILIADDDELICDFLRMHFQKLGFIVMTVNNGKEAIDVCQSTNPDIVLLDIMMPGIDGMSVLIKIRESSSYDLPVIMLTAKTQDENILHALEQGAYDYITKPFNTDELVARVSGILRRCKKIS